jgi:hypothetical protein
MKATHLASGAASLAGLAMLTAMTLGDQPAAAHGSADANRIKTFSCSSNSACVTATNSGSGPGTSASSTNLNGLQGNTNSSNAAVLGQNTSPNAGAGVTGRATSDAINDFAVFGDGGANGGIPLLLTSTYSSTSAALEFLEVDNALDYGYALLAFTSGDIAIQGLFYSAGSCSSGCASRRERIASYGSRETTPTIEDVGEAQLHAGEAIVALDDATLRGIDTRGGYAVFLTAEGDTNGLYVARKTATGFVVQETHGGHSSIPFAYRIVGQRGGARPQRLPFVTITKPPGAAAAASR